MHNCFPLHIFPVKTVKVQWQKNGEKNRITVASSAIALDTAAFTPGALETFDKYSAFRQNIFCSTNANQDQPQKLISKKNI